MNTLLLDTVLWDLVVDANGNIAVATEPYSIIQDVASACRVFQGEVYYDTTLGVAYRNILGKTPPAAFIQTQMESQAELVPGVVSAKAVIAVGANRQVTGQIQSTTTVSPIPLITTIAPLPPPLPQSYLTDDTGADILTDSYYPINASRLT